MSWKFSSVGSSLSFLKSFSFSLPVQRTFLLLCSAHNLSPSAFLLPPSALLSVSIPQLSSFLPLLNYPSFPPSSLCSAPPPSALFSSNLYDDYKNVYSPFYCWLDTENWPEDGERGTAHFTHPHTHTHTHTHPHPPTHTHTEWKKNQNFKIYNNI